MVRIDNFMIELTMEEQMWQQNRSALSYGAPLFDTS